MFPNQTERQACAFCALPNFFSLSLSFSLRFTRSSKVHLSLSSFFALFKISSLSLYEGQSFFKRKPERWKPTDYSCVSLRNGKGKQSNYSPLLQLGFGHLMEGSGQDHPISEMSSDTRKDRLADHSNSSAASGGGGYRLFNRQRSIYQIIGGGKAADVILWNSWGVSVVVIVIATVAWLVFERSGLSFLTITSDVLLILIVLRFIWANSAGMLKKSLRPLPELVLSEEMVNNAAASFRVKVNNMLLVAHDIALGKDFRLFFQVVVFLWLLSVIGSFFSFVTLAYIGIILLITIPAFYNKHEERLDRYAGLVHQKFSKHYKIVDENVLRRLPSRRARDKDD